MIAATVIRQGSVEYMKVATTTDYASTFSTSWTDVPGTALAMPIPAGEHDFFQITFSVGSLQCTLGVLGYSAGACSVRALVDGQVAMPGPVVFGESGEFGRNDLTHSMQWTSNVLAPGTHYVKMQFATGANDNVMGLYARTMTVVRARAY